LVKYCGKECQAEHWKRHKKYCSDDPITKYMSKARRLVFKHKSMIWRLFTNAHALRDFHTIYSCLQFKDLQDVANTIAACKREGVKPLVYRMTIVGMDDTPKTRIASALIRIGDETDLIHDPFALPGWMHAGLSQLSDDDKQWTRMLQWYEDGAKGSFVVDETKSLTKALCENMLDVRKMLFNSTSQ
jgi:Fe-S-cluster containining protein